MQFSTLSGLSAYPEIVHGIFNRHGGVGSAPYDTCNISYGVDDRSVHVEANRGRIKSALGLDRLASATQVHGDSCLLLRERPPHDIEHQGFDAIITDVPGLGLMIQQADCQAVMLFDRRRKVIANIHSGWRGSTLNIIAQTVAAMQAGFGTAPADLHAGISPSLGPCCAEFVNYRSELPRQFHRYRHTENHFDFWAVSRDQLLAAGVAAENIEGAGVCTVCNSDYFSYRREKVTGRFASVIALAQE